MQRQTGNVVIRDFRQEDIEKKVQWINNPENNRYLHYDIPLEVERTKQWYEQKDNSVRQDCVIEFNGLPVGLIGLLGIDRINRKAEYYISMGSVAHKRQGIGAAATKLILEFAFNDLSLNKVFLNVDADNTVACHLYEKAGFHCDGVYRQDLMHRGLLIDRKTYSILRDEFFAKQNKEQINVLLLSVGTRNKVVQYFRKQFQDVGRTVAADASELAPAIYDADKYYIVPRITARNYLETVLDICKRENIRGILSLIDPELSLLAANEERFNTAGVMIIGSSYDLCELSLDKYEMYVWLKNHDYRCARSWINKEQFYADVATGRASYPVFVKPAKGSASIDISKVYDKRTVDLLFAHNEGLLIQEFLNGQEIGADVYIDMISGEVVSIFCKKKLKMRAGETDKAVSFKDSKLFDLIERFVLEAGYSGQVDIDIFDIDGEYFISEVNPRFGGGYPHAYEAGCNHMKLIQENLRGNANKKQIGAYKEGVYMMKYNEVMIRKGLE